MPQRTIRHVFYSYKAPGGSRRVAYQGEKVDLSEEEITRGDELGAFTSSEPVTAASSEPVPSEREPHETPSLAGITGDYEAHSPADLKAEAERRGLDVKGTGANGRVLKDDLVDSLLAHDAGDDTQ
jgi:hypothetical protein